MALFDRLTQRAEGAAKSAAERGRQCVEAAWAQFPDVRIRREGDELVLMGRGLLRRWLGDVRLRFARWSNR